MFFKLVGFATLSRTRRSVEIILENDEVMYIHRQEVYHLLRDRRFKAGVVVLDESNVDRQAKLEFFKRWYPRWYP